MVSQRRGCEFIHIVNRGNVPIRFIFFLRLSLVSVVIRCFLYEFTKIPLGKPMWLPHHACGWSQEGRLSHSCFFFAVFSPVLQTNSNHSFVLPVESLRRLDSSIDALLFHLGISSKNGEVVFYENIFLPVFLFPIWKGKWMVSRPQDTRLKFPPLFQPAGSYYACLSWHLRIDQSNPQRSLVFSPYIFRESKPPCPNRESFSLCM